MSCLSFLSLLSAGWPEFRAAERGGRTQVFCAAESPQRERRSARPLYTREAGLSSYGRAGKAAFAGNRPEVVQTGGNLPAIQNFSGGKAFDRPRRSVEMEIMSMNAIVISLLR